VAKGGSFGYLNKGLVGRDQALKHIGGQLLSLFSYTFPSALRIILQNLK